MTPREKQLAEICIHLANWSGYWNSGCADAGVLEELKRTVKELELLEENSDVEAQR